MQMVVGRAGDENSAWVAQLLQAGRDVHAIAEKIAVFDDDVAQIDARLRMKPNVPPPQLVMSPVVWPRARILKKHWATSSINSATASALLSMMGGAPVPVLCRADAIASFHLLEPAFPVDTVVVNLQNDTLVVISGMSLSAERHGYRADWATRD